MFNGKLYCVRTGDDSPNSFSLYVDDPEAVFCFCRLIDIIRKDIVSGKIADGTDKLLSLHCYGIVKNGVIYGLKEPIFLMSGDEVPEDFSPDDEFLVEPDSYTESEVSE